jgi:hypothetical protein
MDTKNKPSNTKIAKSNDGTQMSRNQQTKTVLSSASAVNGNAPPQTTRFLVHLGENEMKPSFAKSTTTERLLKPNSLSDRFGKLRNRPKARNLLGDELQDESNRSCTDAPEKSVDQDEQDPLSKHSHILEAAYKNMDEPFDHTPNKVLHSMLVGLNKINKHHVGSKFVTSVEQKMKHVSAAAGALSQHKSLSDRFSISNKHNSSLGFNHWKMMSIMDGNNNPNQIKYANEKIQNPAGMCFAKFFSKNRFKV